VDDNQDSLSEGFPELGTVPEELSSALARARRATEELPPLEELAALQEAMIGLAEMGSLLDGMGLQYRRTGEGREGPTEGPE
jgi:hypothetical protein